jgi:hypothetical protein
MAEQQTAAAEGAEPDALDALDEALADDPTAGDGAEAEEWTPPTREEYEAQQAAHRAALEAEQGKLKRAREQAKRLREGKPATAADGTPAPADGASAADLALWQGRAVRAAAEGQLLARHADPEMVDLLLARLKPDQVDFDEDGRPDLDEWLDEMQERYSKAFAPPAAPAAAQPRRPGRVDQGAAATGQPARPQLSLGEKILAKSEAARSAGRRSRI